MSDRTRIAPSVAPADPLALERDKRFVSNAVCGNCFHGYRYRISQDQIQPTLICHEGPPAMQILQLPQGLAPQVVPRVVPEGYFCHHWKQLHSN